MSMGEMESTLQTNVFPIMDIEVEKCRHCLKPNGAANHCPHCGGPRILDIPSPPASPTLAVTPPHSASSSPQPSSPVFNLSIPPSMDLDSKNNIVGMKRQRQLGAKEMKTKRLKMINEIITEAKDCGNYFEKHQSKTVIFQLCPNFLLPSQDPWQTEPLDNGIFRIDVQKNNKEKPNSKYGQIQMLTKLPGDAKLIEFPTTMEVKNNATNLKLANQIMTLLKNGHTVKAFESCGSRHLYQRAECSYQRAECLYRGYLVLAFGRTVEEDEKYLPEWRQKQDVINERKKQRKEKEQEIKQFIEKIKTIPIKDADLFINKMGLRKKWEEQLAKATRNALCELIALEYPNEYRLFQ